MEALKPAELSEKSIGKTEDDFGLMTGPELAALLGLELKTIQNMVARRELPFVRLGRQTMFLKESVRKWLHKKEFKPRGHH